MGRTKKVKTTGRFGSRYGVGIRRRVIKIEAVQKKKHKCPKCGFLRVKRLAAGIYECKKCKTRIAGGAYLPETMSGSIVRKMVTQKAFVPHIKELTEVKEPKIAEQKLEETAKEQKQEKPVEAKPKAKEEKPKKKKAAEKPKKEKAEKKKASPAKAKSKAKPKKVVKAKATKEKKPKVEKKPAKAKKSTKKEKK